MKKIAIITGIILTGIILIIFAIFTIKKQLFLSIDYKVLPSQKLILSDEYKRFKKLNYFNRMLSFKAYDTIFTFFQVSRDSFVLKSKISVRNVRDLMYYKNYLIYRTFKNVVNVIELATGEVKDTINLKKLGKFYLPTYYYFDSLIAIVSHYYEKYNRIYLLCFYNYKKEEFSFCYKFNYPDTITSNLYLIYVNGDDDYIYFSNRYSTYLYRYNIKEKKVDSTLATSILLSSIPYSESEFKEFFSPRYSRIELDTINGYIHRIYWQQTPYNLAGYVIINTKSFKKVGEFSFSGDKPYITMVNKKFGIVQKNNQLRWVKYKYYYTLKTIWQNKIKSKYLPKNSELNLKSLDTLNEQNLVKYLKTINEFEDSTLYLILPASFSCSGILNYTYVVLQTNYNLLKKHLTVIWTGYPEQLADVKFDFIDDSNFVKVDTNMVFYRLFRLTSYNPILVYYLNEKEAKFYKKYSATNIDSLTIDIANIIFTN